MGFRRWRQFVINNCKLSLPMTRAKAFALVFLVGGVSVVVNQNCAGSGTSGFGSVGSGKVNSILSAHPIPVQYNLNEISYMSCPQAGASTGATGDPLGQPFYRIRVGSFDNSATNGFVDPKALGNPVDNVSGLGFTQAAMNYMRSIDPIPNPSVLSNYLTTSPYTNGAQPVIAMVNQYRTQYSLSWTALASTVLTPLTDPTLVSSLANATQQAGGGTVPQGYFDALPIGNNTIAGTLSWGQSVLDESNFRTNLINQYILAGFAPAASTSPTTITQSLASPDGAPTGRLFGYGYSFVFGPNSPNLNQVYEWDLNPSTGGNPTNLTTQNNQLWDCFALTVVRDIDRKYWTISKSYNAGAYSSTAYALSSEFLKQASGATASDPAVPNLFYAGAPVHPLDVISLGQGNPSLQANYFSGGAISAAPQNYPMTTNSVPYVMYSLERYYSAAWSPFAAIYNASVPAGSPIVQASPTLNAGSTFFNNVAGIGTVNLYMGSNGYDGGTYYACPPEDPTLSFIPLAGDTPAVLTQKAINSERLRIIRRFLPADKWEVNVASMCAVPTATAEAMGSCYASGDSDQTKYIQYNGTPGSNCGPGLTECSAKVSFCWRYH